MADERHPRDSAPERPGRRACTSIAGSHAASRSARSPVDGPDLAAKAHGGSPRGEAVHMGLSRPQESIPMPINQNSTIGLEPLCRLFLSTGKVSLDNLHRPPLSAPTPPR